MTCDEIRGEVAAAMLTRDPIPVPVAVHLDGCAECRAAIHALEPLPGLLAVAPPAAPSDVDDLLPRLLAAAATERRHRRRATLLWSTAAAAAVVLLAAGLLGTLMLRAPVDTAASPGASSRADAAVTADVLLHHTATGGALVDVAVSGLPPGTVCTVEAVTSDGSRYQVMSWRVGDYGTGHVHGRLPAGVAASSITTVDLVDSRGVLLAQSTPRPGGESIAN